MVQHGLELEVWSSRFATKLCAVQSVVDRPLAVKLAHAVQGVLGTLLPEDAVDTFLTARLEQFNDAEATTQRLLEVAAKRS